MAFLSLWIFIFISYTEIFILARTPNIGYDFKTNSGNAFNYFSFGVACSEVEIDCLTGDHKVKTQTQTHTHPPSFLSLSPWNQVCFTLYIHELIVFCLPVFLISDNGSTLFSCFNCISKQSFCKHRCWGQTLWWM